jgi:nicotinic acid mononucleotide adenylyltransferase
MMSKPTTRMHWKIRRDPYLARVAELHGEEAAFQAGFFLDEDDEDAPLDDVDWLCTPLPRRRPVGRRPAVLLSTGAFCPIHDGHLAMMQRAREAAERAGFDVLGGYISPGHDAYIEAKCGPAAIPASVRLQQCARVAEASGWLLVDPWEAIHRRVAVNFTDVTARLRAYLRAHLDPRVEVLFVCGADNARFALAFAFAEDGGCVIVGRPGSDAEMDAWRARLETHARILWTGGDHPAASRALRAPEWIDPRERRIVVRTEDARAVRTLAGKDPRIAARYVELQRSLLRTLGEHATVRTAPLESPCPVDQAVISLDAMLPATHNLAVSRLFALGGYQLLGHVARPGQPSVEEQIAAIPAGTYVLREDDRMTGGTLAAVRALLPDRLRIAGVTLGVGDARAAAVDEDIVDSRDFLLGADDGGLVVELSGGRIGRAPYVLPYVDPAARASVPSARAHSFSRCVWSLNEQVFRGTKLRVRDLPPASRAIFQGLGDDVSLEEVCRWHGRRLAAVRRRHS